MISFHIQILGMCDKSSPNSLGDLRVGIVSDSALQYYHDTWVTIQYRKGTVYESLYTKYCALANFLQFNGRMISLEVE